MGQRRHNLALERSGFEVVFFESPQPRCHVGSEFHSSAAQEEVWAGTTDGADGGCGWSGCCLGRSTEQDGRLGLAQFLRNATIQCLKEGEGSKMVNHTLETAKGVGEKPTVFFIKILRKKKKAQKSMMILSHRTAFKK